MTTAKAIDSLLDDLIGAEVDEVRLKLGGLDNPDLYIDNHKPVDIVQFVEDELFLGTLVKCEPQVLQLLWQIEQPGVREAFIEVGKGSGKSFVGSIVPTYGAYVILHMRRPHVYFGLTRATTIASINVSIGRQQAKEVIFKQIKGLVANCPWFTQNAPSTPLTQQLDFIDKDVTLYCGHSNSTAFLGFATIRAILDEANFLVNNANRNVAEGLFSALHGSCITRFPNDYKLVSISSASTPRAWLHEQIENIRRNGKEVPLIPQGIQGTNQKHDTADNMLGDFDPFEK